MPEVIDDEEALDAALSVPSPALIDLFRSLDGDILILGIGGKIGPSLAMTAVRAARESGVLRRVVGVSRFSEPALAERLRERGVEPVACDLLDAQALRGLPKIKNVVFMAGRKFGTIGSEGLTWATNALIPARVAERFADSRIVVFSTGCVYPLVDVKSGACTEDVPPDPVGEYASSCLARERVFSYYSALQNTPICLFRLNYAIDLRYGVLHDLAMSIWSGRPVSLSIPAVNIIWQGDVNDRALRALARCEVPPRVLNITGTETLDVRRLALALGELLHREVSFEGEAGQTALIADSGRATRLFGPPRVGLRKMLEWTAAWVARGGRSLGKPTHFEVTDGRY